MWLASLLGLAICYLATNADSFGLSLSWLDPILEDHLGFIVLFVSAVAAFFCVQLTVNHLVLRDRNGGRLNMNANIRLCARVVLLFVSVPVALVAFHLGALVLISAV